MMRYLIILILLFISSCKEKKETNTQASAREDLLSLERKWLEAEFALDTAYLSTLIDSTFIGISGIYTTNKSEELRGMFNNISAMRRDSIFLDSIKLEVPEVHLYENMAVVTFITHSYKKDKGKNSEKRMRFSDVWINREGKWKAIVSHATPLME